MKNFIGKFIVSTLVFPVCLNSSHAADYSIGGVLGSQGVGGTFSLKSGFSLVEGDQLQFRVSLSGIAGDDIDDVEIGDVDYEADIATSSVQGGLSWYPFSSKYTDRFFVSTGLIYFDNDLEGASEKNQAFRIGDFQVGRNDDTRLRTDIEQSSLAPYLSLGWGDRIREESGLSFRAELGVLMPFSDPDVELSVAGNANAVPVADLAKERKQIEDDLDGLLGYAEVALTYHF